jgi:hypothetical protein
MKAQRRRLARGARSSAGEVVGGGDPALGLGVEVGAVEREELEERAAPRRGRAVDRACFQS